MHRPVDQALRGSRSKIPSLATLATQGLLRATPRPSPENLRYKGYPNNSLREHPYEKMYTQLAQLNDELRETEAKLQNLTAGLESLTNRKRPGFNENDPIGTRGSGGYSEMLTNRTIDRRDNRTENYRVDPKWEHAQKFYDNRNQIKQRWFDLVEDMGELDYLEEEYNDYYEISKNIMQTCSKKASKHLNNLRRRRNRLLGS